LNELIDNNYFKSDLQDKKKSLNLKTSSQNNKQFIINSYNDMNNRSVSSTIPFYLKSSTDNHTINTDRIKNTSKIRKEIEYMS
jgi:hypothetical protein